MKASKAIHPVRLAKRKLEKTLLPAKDSKIECLEGRIAPATLYVDNFSDLASHITTDNGAPGLDAGDIVTWDPGAASHHGGAVAGLTFGVNVFSTITDALSAAAATGDTIRVGPGVFTESFNVTKQVTLLGNQTGYDAVTRAPLVGTADETILHGALSGSLHNTQVTVSTNDVVLDGFLVEGQTNGNVFGSAIYEAPGTHGTQVTNNIIQDNITGVYISNNSTTDQGVVSHNLFRNNTQPGPASGQDIYADQFTAGSVQHVLIANNTFTNSSYVEDAWAIGISNTGGTAFQDLVIQNNTISNHGRGMYFYNTDTVTISGNDIGGAGRYGVGIFGLNGTPANANFTITGNTIHDSYRGIYISDDTSASAVTSVPSMTGNTFTNTTIPADLELYGSQIIGAVDFGTADVTIIGDAIDFVGGAGSVTGTGKITLVPLTANASIGLNGGTGTLQLDHADLLALGSSFSQIIVGTAGQAHTISIDTDNTVTLTVPLTLNADGVGGSIHIGDSNTGNGITALKVSGGLTIHGSGSTTVLATDIVTVGTPILIADSVQLIGTNITLDTTGAGLAPTGAGITITGAIDADAAVNTRNLTLQAGTAGTSTVGGAIGGTAHLDNLTVTGLGLSTASTLAIDGNLAITLTSALTQSAAWTVVGTTTLSTGAANDLTLNNAGNDFSSVGITSSKNALLKDVNALTLNASTTSGNLGVTAGGILTVGGAISTTALSGSVSGTTGGITLTAGGDINLNAALTTGAAPGGSGFTTTSGSISLTSTGGAVIGNASGRLVTGDASGTSGFAGNAHTTSGSITVTAAGEIRLAAVDALQTGLATTDDATDSSQTGDVTLSATKVSSNGTNGAVDVHPGAFLTGGTGARGALRVTTTGGAGDAGGAFFTSGEILVLGTSNVTGNYAVSVSTALTQNGALTIGGAATFTAGAANNITLSTAGNDFNSVSIVSGNNVSLTDANALILAASTVSGTLGVTTGGALTQSGVLSVTGAATFAAGAANDITLTTAGNDFSSVTITSGKNVSLVDANALTLNASTVSGNLSTNSTSLTVGGAVSVTGDATLTMDTLTMSAVLTAGAAKTAKLLPRTAGLGITVGGTVGGTLSLTDATLDNVVAGTVQVGDATVGAINVAGAITQVSNLSLVTGAGVSGSGAVGLAAGKNLSISANGAINLTGAVTVPGTTTLSAGAANNITLTNTGNDFNSVAITTGNNVSIVDANAVTLAASTVSGTLGVTANSLTVSGALGVTGAVTFNADAMTIGAGVTSAGTVTLAPRTGGVAINVGGADSAGVLGLTAAELGFISAAGGLLIGSASAGNVTVSAPVDLTVGPVATKLVLTTGAAIVDGNATGTDLKVNQLVLNAPTGVGTSGDPLETAVVSLDFNNATSGGVYVANSGALTLTDLDGTAATAVGGAISASSPVTINSSMTFTAATTITAGNSASTGDTITISSGAVITLSGAAAFALTLNAGDDIVFSTGSITSTGAGVKTVNLNADLEGALDADRGSVTQTGTSTSVTAGVLNISAPEAIGSSGTPFRFSATTLSTNTSGLTGNQFLFATTATSVSNLNAGSGAATPASGTINLVSGTFNLIAGDAIADTSAVVVANPSVLNLNNDNETIGSLAGDGTVDLGQAVSYTFGGNSDDGQRLRIDLNRDGILNSLDDVILDDAQHGPQDKYSSTVSLGSGNYLFEYMYYERGGGDEGEAFYAPGTFSSFNSNFRLIGDSSQGISIVGSITANTYKSGTLNSIAQADAIRLPGNLIGSATVARVNFLGSGGGGNFGSDITPPGISGNVDDYAVYATGTLTSSGGAPGTLTVGGNNASTSFTGTIGTGDSGGLVKTGTGTMTLTNSNSYTGTTDVNAGTLSVTGTLATGGGVVTVNSGGTLVGTGTVARNVSVASGGTLAPGISGPGVLNTNNLTLVAGATFAVDVNGATVGTQYDQANVTGTVNLTGATLTATGTITSVPGQQIVLINNDGTDAVTGTFNGLPEGSTVTINGVNFMLTYAGGTGNDVVLVDSATTAVQLSGGNLTVTDTLGGSTDDNLTIAKNGTFIRISDPTNNLFAGPGTTQIDLHTVDVPIASITGNTTFNTLGGNDTVTVNFAGGNPIPSGGLFYNGGTQTASDKLVVTGGTTTTVTHNFTNANDGNIVLAGALAGTINYTGLEPITDNLSATDRIFNFNGGTESITLVDDVGATMTIDSSLSESVTFADPTNSLTINAGTGDDTVAITSMDAAYHGILTFDGGANNDSLTLGAGLPSLSTLTITTESIAALPGLTIGAGGFSLTSTSSDITQTGAISVSGATILNVGATHDITLATAGDDFSSVSIVTGKNVSLTDANALILAASTVSGTLGVTTSGAITQSGVLSITGAATFAAGAGNDITLATAGNDFSSVGITTGKNVSLTDANALILAASTVSGTLGVTTSGTITQSGALVVTGAATFAAGAGNDITLTTAGNDFSSVGITTGKNVSLTDANALILAASTVSGTLGVTTNGAITQSGVLSVTGAATFAAGAANDITLTNASNDFNSVGITTGKNVSLVDANALILAASTVSGTFGVTTSGTITQSGALVVTGAATFAAGAANDITLTNASNDFSSVGITTGKNVSLTDANALILAASTVSGTLGVTTNGALTQSGVLSVTGAATFAAGAANDITLTNASNDFSSVGITTGKNVSLVDANALILAASTVSGTFGVTTSGTITQSGALVVTGAATFAAGAGNDITLTTAGNDFSSVGITTGKNVSLVDANALILAASTVSGTLGVTTNGAITQSGALVVTGATTLAAGAANDITLTNPGNNFSSVGITTGKNVSLVDSNAIVLAASTVSGTLGVTTSGALTQSGALSVTGAATFAAGAANDITLNNAGNDFSSVGITTGNNVLLVDVNALVLATSVVSGTLGVTTNGAITQTGPITVASTSSFASGANNAIALSDPANDFVGAVSVTNSGTGAVSVRDTNALVIGTFSVGTSTLTLTAGNGITQTGTITQAAGAGAVTLSGNAGAINLGLANNFTGAVTASTTGAAAAITMADTAGGLNAVSITTTDGAITLTANNGTLAAGTVTAGNGGLITLTTTGGSGAITVDNVATTGNVNITAVGTVNEPSADAGVDIAANVLTINAGASIGSSSSIEINATSLTASSTGTGGQITVNDTAGGLVVTSATTTDGDITIVATGGDLTAILINAVTAGATARNIQLTTITSGNVLVNSVTAAGHTINISSAGAIEESGADAGADLVADTISMNAATGIGSAAQIEVDVNTVTASIVSAVGAINLSDVAGGMTVTSATTTNGAITLNAVGGDLTLATVSAGTGGLITLSTTTSGNILLGNVSTTGNASVTSAGAVSENGSDAGADISANNLTISAVNAIGLGGTIEIDATTLTASTSAANAGIDLADVAGGLTVTSAVTSTSGAITLSAAGGNLVLTTVNSSGTGAAGNVTATTTGSGNIVVDNVFAVSDTLTLTAAGSILEAGAGDAGADLNAGILILSAGTGIGSTSGAGAIETAINNSLSGTTATGGVNLANTGVLTITGLTVTTSGDINLTNAGALTTSGVVSTASGKITMSAASPITVGANMTATGDILLTAGEISDAPTWADDFTLNGGATIQSTAGNITLRAGDDIHLAAGTTVNAFGSVTLQAGFGDLDGAGSLDLQGTVISGGALNFSAPGDIVVGFLNAPGQIVTLTADSDNNGTGGIYRDGVAATNVIAGTLIASASTRIAAGPDAGAYGIHLVTQVSNLAATVANGAGDISIANSGGALSVTSATTSNGNITLSNAGGTLTVPTVTAGGTADISITTTGAGSNVLVGALSASGDTITVNSSGAIVDNNGAANNFAALNLSLTGVSGIGAADPLESTVTNLVATNTTGDIKLKNTGALTINGANVTGASGAITIDAASPIVIAANESAPGAISHTAGEISDSPTFADDLTLNAGISITSTGASVTLLAGDDILTGAGSTISAATTVTITAASGDLDNHGAIALGGTITSGTGATLSARDAIALGGNVSATSGTISVTSTVGSITHSAGTLAAPTVSLSASAGSIGAVGAEVLTTTGTLTTASSGDQFVTESDGANVSGSSTAGSIHFTTTTGDWTIVAPGITAAVDVFMTATTGAILDNGAAGNTTIDITANHVTLQASTGIGQVGGNLDLDVSTVTSAISNTGGVRLDLQDSNNSGVTVTLVTATTSGSVNLTGSLGSAVRHIGAVTATSGNLSVSAAAGDIDLTGNHTASGTITETATAGNITHAAGTLTAPTVTLSASGAIGATGADVLTSTNSLTTTSSGDQHLTEANGLTAINLTAGASDVYLTLTAGAIADTDGAVDVVAHGLVALAQGAIGTLANPIQTTIANLEANSQTGGVFLNETDALTIGGISIQTGVYAGGANIAISSGALTIAEDINTTFNVALNSTGTITETTGAVKNAALLTTDSVGGQTLNGANTVASFDADNLTSGDISLQNAIGNLTIVKIANLVGAATVTNAGSMQLGDSSNQNINVSGIATITAAAGGAMTDGNGATNNITALAAVLSASAGIGTTANPIETNINNLEAAGGTGGVFITEADALFIGGVTAMNGVSATAGNIEIDSGNLSITEQISTPATVDLDVTGTVAEFGSGFVNANLFDVHSAGGETLNGPNTVHAFTAVNTGAGTGISLQNTANNFNIQAVTNQTGGNIFINNDGTDATISGVIKSGTPMLGGDIFVQTDGQLTVNATVDSSGGSGGTLTLGGLLLLNASPIVGAGDITLQGGDGPLTINAPISVASPLVLQSTEDVNILAKVETTTLTADITVLADLDNNGTGGVLISDNVYIGSLKAGRNLDIRGSEYQGSFDAGLANLDNGVIIDDNGSNPRVEAVGNVFMKINNGAPATAQIWLGGLVRSNTSGDVQFDSAILVTSDNAKALTHGAGDVIFFSTIDSGTGGPFNLRAATDVGVVLFNGEVGGVAPMDDVTVETASDVIVNAALTAGSFSVGNASGTVEIHGDLTTMDSGLNLSINAVSLVTTAAIDMTGGTGNGLLQVNNIDLGGDVSGDGVLTIQPRDTARSIGVNAAGDLNLDNTEIDHLQNGFQQILIGRADGSGLITVGARIAPDFWHDPVVFRSQAVGGQIQLTGQIYADDDGGFTFLAPTTIVNTPGLPSISAGTGDVNFGSLTYATAVTLLSNLDIETIGGDVLQVGTVNGHFALTIDAGTGAVNLNGGLTATPTGTSIGGITALDSISISGGAITLRPNVQTEGDQTYTGTTIQIFSGAYTATNAGSIAFNGAMTLSNSVGVFTHGGDIDFNGTMDNVADPSTPAGKGALTANAQTGAITFTGNVGTGEALKSVDINGASLLTVNDDFSVFGSFKVKADEVDLLGGINSVHVDGGVEFHPASSNVQIEIGGSETATPNSLSLSDDDIAALADGATSIIISQTAAGRPITVVGPVTFHDPTSIFTNAKTGGNVTVDGDITADTADGGVTLKGLNVFLNADITTLGGGSIDISNGVIAGATILDTSAGDGNVTLRDKFLAIGTGHDLTISTGAGDINILTRLGSVTGVLGDVTLTSSGDTVIKTGGYMDSLTVDGGGTTFLGGRVQTGGVDGQDYVDAVILTSGVSLVSTHAAGVIHFEDTVNSDAGKLRNLAITNHAALAGTEVVTFDAGSDIGLALPLGGSRLGTLNVQTRGDATFGGDINAVSVTVKAGNFAIQNVTALKNLLLNGDGDFNGVLTADKLTIRSTGDIDNGGTAWVATTSATLYSLAGDITVTGANAFGTLALTGHDATVEQAGNLNLGAVSLKGTLDVTTTAGGNLTQLATQRVLAAKLEGSIAGSISLGHVRNTFTQIGDATVGLTAGGPIEIWSARPRATILDGTISTAAGDITLVADPNGKVGYFQVGPDLALDPAGRWVVFSSYGMVPAYNIDLEASLSPDTVIENQNHPYVGVLPGGNLLIYKVRVGRQ